MRSSHRVGGEVYASSVTLCLMDVPTGLDWMGATGYDPRRDMLATSENRSVIFLALVLNLQAGLFSSPPPPSVWRM